MSNVSYGQFCPVAMAAEILCTRWTVVLLRELMAGSTRFNELRRGVPRMSPALLSQRLKELEQAGLVSRRPVRGDPSTLDYRLTPAGDGLKPLIEAFGHWGQRWISTELSLTKLDVSLLMWDMRRNLDPRPLPRRKSVIAFQYPQLPATQRNWWLLVDPGAGVDLCSVDPGFDVDLYVSTDLRTMTAIWMGVETVRQAVSARRFTMTGERALSSDIQSWLGLSPFARAAARPAAAGRAPAKA
jgi:DNA-binding HxlR family transcriptional regulator